MNTYIKNKLDEFKEKYPNMQSENDEYTAIPTVELIEQSLTDYHNHIVEKINELPAFTSCSDKTMGKVSDEAKVPMYGTHYLERETVLSLLQDTNPKE